MKRLVLFLSLLVFAATCGCEIAYVAVRNENPDPVHVFLSSNVGPPADLTLLPKQVIVYTAPETFLTNITVQFPNGEWKSYSESELRKLLIDVQYQGGDQRVRWNILQDRIVPEVGAGGFGFSSGK
jgi:hypothetical protein